MKSGLSPSLPEAAWLTRGPAVIRLADDIFLPHEKDKRFDWKSQETRADFLYDLRVEFMRAGLAGVKKWPVQEDWKLLDYLLQASVENRDSSRVELDGQKICGLMNWKGEKAGPRRLALSLARWANIQFVFSISHEGNEETFQLGSGSFIAGYQELWDNRFAVSISKNLTWPLKQKLHQPFSLALLDSIHTQFNDQRGSR